MRPLPIRTEAFVKFTVPKSVSGSARQAPVPVHVDGASAIHSAEVVSALVNGTRLLIEVSRVWSLSVSVT